MGIPFFGGFDYVDSGLLGPNAVFVDLVTSYADRYYQLYAGRTLIGVTTDPTRTRIVGQLNPQGGGSVPLTVVAVAPEDIATDFSAEIPLWPSDRFSLSWSTSYGGGTDVDHFLISRSDSAGGADDTSNVIGRVNYTGDGPYTFDSPPLPACGAWTYGVTPYDNAQPTGNPGATATVTVQATIPPLDLVPDSQGNRFEAAVAAGVLSISLIYPS
jgi:hypothetical protein